MPRRHPNPLHVLVVSVACTAAACAPSLNWREVHVADTGAIATFPCKPDVVSRRVTLANTNTEMALLSCAAGGVTYALGHALLPDPEHAALALQQMQTLAAAHVNGAARQLGPAEVPGMTPSLLAQRLRVAGRRPDGSALTEEAVFFVKGLRVFQASAVGTTLDDAAFAEFLAGLKLAG